MISYILSIFPNIPPYSPWIRLVLRADPPPPPEESLLAAPLHHSPGKTYKFRDCVSSRVILSSNHSILFNSVTQHSLFAES